MLASVNSRVHIESRYPLCTQAVVSTISIWDSDKSKLGLTLFTIACRLLLEIDEVLGDKENVGVEDLEHLQYTEQVDLVFVRVVVVSTVLWVLDT